MGYSSSHDNLPKGADVVKFSTRPQAEKSALFAS